MATGHSVGTFQELAIAHFDFGTLQSRCIPRIKASTAWLVGRGVTRRGHFFRDEWTTGLGWNAARIRDYQTSDNGTPSDLVSHLVHGRLVKTKVFSHNLLCNDDVFVSCR